MKNELNIQREIIRRIKGMPPEKCFSRSDFAQTGSRAAISQALSRLERSGKIASPLRGYYCQRRFSRLLEVELPVDYGELAEAVARNSGWMIIPCGDIGANILGLSAQVPAVWSYASTGPYRTYNVGGTRLEFKHTANREIFSMSRKSAMVVQALKAIGRKGVTTEIIARLSSALTAQERNALLEETSRVTSWVYEVVQRISKENGNAECR